MCPASLRAFEPGRDLKVMCQGCRTMLGAWRCCALACSMQVIAAAVSPRTKLRDSLQELIVNVPSKFESI